MRPRLTSVAAAGMVIAALAACSEGADAGSTAAAKNDEGLVERAKKEGQVVLYPGFRDESIAAVKKAFEAKYGIEVVIKERLSSAALAQRVDADIRTNDKIGADWVQTTDQALATHLRKEGYSRPVSVDLFPGLDSNFVEGDAAIGCTVGVPVVGYNKDVLGEDFKIDSWDDLLDPKLAGKIMVADPRGSAAWASTWSAVLNDSGLGDDYISKIAGQDPQIVASSLVGTEQLVAGQGGVLLFGIPGLFEPAMEAGQKIDFWYPKDPAPVFFNFCLLPERAEHPNAGLLFFQWFMSEEGQELVQGIEGLASPLGNLEGTVPLPENFTKAPEPFKVEKDMPRILESLGIN